VHCTFSTGQLQVALWWHCSVDRALGWPWCGGRVIWIEQITCEPHQLSLKLLISLEFPSNIRASRAQIRYRLIVEYADSRRTSPAVPFTLNYFYIYLVVKDRVSPVLSLYQFFLDISFRTWETAFLFVACSLPTSSDQYSCAHQCQTQ